MSFEVRDPRGSTAVVFADDEWHNLLALAHACGFDPDREQEEVANLGAGEARELGAGSREELRVAIKAVLDQELLPFAQTWEEEDVGEIPFRWVGTPWYYAENSDREFHLKREKLERLLGMLDRGLVVEAR